MTWDEIKEIENSEIGFIGHHSHTHEYLIDMNESEFINDIETATQIFKDELDSDLEKNTLVKNISVIMKLMLPFIPHLANECLELHGCKTVNQWPSIDKNIGSEIIKFAVQINGKTRDIIEIEANLSEAQINNIVNKSSKAKKYLLDKKIIKTIFINNKIINYIV